MEEKREGLKTEDLETEEERFGTEEGRLDTDGLKTEKLDPQRFICWVGQHPHPILRSAVFFIGVWKQRAMRTGVTLLSDTFNKRATKLTILAWNRSPTYVQPLIFPIIP